MEGAPKDLALPLAEVGLALALAEAEDALAAPSPPALEAGLAVAVTLNENGGGNPGGGKDARDDAPLAALPAAAEEGADALALTVLLGEDDDLRGALLADVENRTRDVLVGLLPPPPAADVDALPELPLAAPLPLPLATPDDDPPLLLLLEDALAAAPAAGKNISMTPITPSCCPAAPPSPAGRRTIRMRGLPSSVVNVNCPVPLPTPPRLVNDAKICSMMAALIGKAVSDC